MKRLGLVAAMSVVVLSVWVGDLSAGHCVISQSGRNQNRKVMGPVSAECSRPHSVPFGNWGVTSNVGHKVDGHQFNGWCRNRVLCDNYGDCTGHCQDSWYEWNSCTTDPQWKPDNCDLYNYNSCSQQITTRGENTHGSTTTDVYVSCPYDSDGDGTCDTGGCAAITSFSSGTNWMALYELDLRDDDELVQSMYFPSVTLNLNCGVMSCNSATSSWLTPTSYDTPRSPALVYSQLAFRVTSGRFVDTGGTCAQRAAIDDRYDCD